MGAVGQQLGLRLFLEGIEVPVIAAQVQINLNAPATAAVQVVPTDEILNLKARTMLHVFFWDSNLDLELASNTVAQENSNGSTTAVDQGTDPLKGYKLLFCGEVVGLSMMRTPMGRQAVLQCADFSTYWDTTYQFMLSFGSSNSGGNFLGSSAAVWSGAEGALFNDIIDGHRDVMNSYLKRRPQSPGLSDVKGLMGGIISLLEAMGGVPKHQHGVNDFFTIAELKNHLMQQIVAEQDDDTAQRLFDDKTFMDWLTQGLSSMGQLVTFRDMLKLLFQYVYYECVPNPCAKYVQGQQSKILSVKEGTLVFPEAMRNRLVELFQTSILRGQERFDFEGKPSTVATANELNSVNPNSGGSQRLIGGDMRDELTKMAKTKGLFPQVKAKIELAASAADTVARRSRDEVDKIRADWTAVANNIEAALAAGGVPKSQRFKKVEKSKPKVDRLQSQIFRPDCFFAAPPRCNVFFPETYTSFNFSKNFLQEVTRLRLTTSMAFVGTGPYNFFANSFFAPATKDIKDLAKKQGNSSVRALLPWEKFSGILPKFETCAEINYRSGRTEKKLGLSKKNIKGQSTNFAQRAANFNYLKYRFASRGCDISMKFNPYVVCGFPGAVITKPFQPTQSELLEAVSALNKQKGVKKITADDASDHIRDLARYMSAPTHFLGMVAGVAHSVSQDGGNTSVTLTHARSHRITDDDFMKIYIAEKTVEARTKLVSTELDADDLIAKGEWKKIQLLIDSTNPATVSEQQIPDNPEQDAQQNPDTNVDLGDRPNGLPSLADNDQLAPFTLLNPQLPSIGDPESVTFTSTEGNFSFKGATTKSFLKNSRTPILEPAPYGKIKPGTKGPHGGKVAQIQCYTDQIIKVTGDEINARLKAQSNFKITRRVNAQGQSVADVERVKTKPKIDKDKTFYLWRKIAIWEEVVAKDVAEKSIPVEEALRPPWFTPLYSNWFIGEKIYDPFFGCNSVVDTTVFTLPNGAVGTFGTSRPKQQQLIEELRSADGDNNKMMQVLDKAKATDIADVPDIESSLDALAYVYGEVRRLGFDVHRFVQDYTHRPIATLEDMFGSDDLQYSLGTPDDPFDSRKTAKATVTAKENLSGRDRSPFASTSQKLTLVSGRPGFHSTAIAPYGSLLGLVDNPDAELPRLSSKGKKFPLAKDLDPRPERRAAVQEYADSLQAGTGSLGIGLLG